MTTVMAHSGFAIPRGLIWRPSLIVLMEDDCDDHHATQLRGGHVGLPVLVGDARSCSSVISNGGFSDLALSQSWCDTYSDCYGSPGQSAIFR